MDGMQSFLEEDAEEEDAGENDAEEEDDADTSSFLEEDAEEVNSTEGYGSRCGWATRRIWSVTPVLGFEDKVKTQIIRLADAEYVRVYKQEIDGQSVTRGKDTEDKKVHATVLEIKMPNEEDSVKIIGGGYIPKFAVDFALNRFWPSKVNIPPRDDHNIYVSDPVTQNGENITNPAQWNNGLPPTYKVKMRISGLFKYLDEYLEVRTYYQKNLKKEKGWYFPVLMPIGMFGSFAGAISGAFLGISSIIVLGPVAGIMLYIAGFYGGAFLPWLGVIAGVNYLSAANARNQLRTIASEKIYQKMRCHNLFQRCAGNALAPKKPQGQCPEIHRINS
jgi:hypothetical protein